MLRKLRRSSKDPVSGEDGSIVTKVNSANTLPSELVAEESSIQRLTFFDLPAEIRNEIYEIVISETTLSIPTNILGSSKKPKLLLRRRKSLATPINGLLLASRQCRQEYLSALLSTASVVVEVKDFDFENLMRVSSGLGDFEIQALQTNRHLTLELHNRNCTREGTASLRRWLDFRRKNLERNLPWNYEFPLDKLLPPTTMGRVRLLRELEYYADTIAPLVEDVEEPQQLELKSIIEAFESKAHWIEDNIGWLGQRSKTISRHARGLPGGGIY